MTRSGWNLTQPGGDKEVAGPQGLRMALSREYISPPRLGPYRDRDSLAVTLNPIPGPGPGPANRHAGGVCM
jgi:hypothetical protein